MTPGYNNGVMLVNVEDSFVGFYIADGNDDVLPSYIEETWKREVTDFTVEQAKAALQPVKDAIVARGYATGPIETKSHKEWCVGVFGVDPVVYDENERLELEAQSTYDSQDDS